MPSLATRILSNDKGKSSMSEEEDWRPTLDRLEDELSLLKEALRETILNRSRVTRRTVEVDPAGNTYDYDWMPWVRRAAALCELDLDRYDPSHYTDDWRLY